MSVSNLKWMAKRLLSKRGLRRVLYFIRKGKPERAKAILLEALELYYDMEAIEFPDVAEYVLLLDLDEEVVKKFPWKYTVTAMHSAPQVSEEVECLLC